MIFGFDFVPPKKKRKNVFDFGSNYAAIGDLAKIAAKTKMIKCWLKIG